MAPIRSHVGRAVRLHCVVGLAIALSVSSCKPRRSASGAGNLNDSDARAAENWNGNAPWRLVFSTPTGAGFDFNVDVTRSERGAAARATAEQLVEAAVAEAMIPLWSELTSSPTGRDGPLFDSLMAASARFGSRLQGDAANLVEAARANGPFVHDTWLVPWKKPERDQFYAGDKISLEPARAVNVLGVLPGSDQFPTKLTAAISEIAIPRCATSVAPVCLLAMRSFLSAGVDGGMLTIRILMRLKPMTSPFTQTNEKVRFERVVIPEPGVDAMIRISIPISRTEGPPTALAEFGRFEKVERGEFRMTEAGRQRSMPRLEGSVNRRGLTWIATNFSFTSLTFDMRRMQVAALDTLVSPGLRFARGNWVAGGLQLDSVDTEFTREINRTIDAQIVAGAQTGSGALLEGGLERDVIEKLFAQIFGRQPGGGT